MMHRTNGIKKTIEEFLRKVRDNLEKEKYLDPNSYLDEDLSSFVPLDNVTWTTALRSRKGCRECLTS